MIDAVLKSLEDFFGEHILAWIIASGYLIYLLIFFQKDVDSDDIWHKFQWGDRVLIGVIIGAFYYFAFVLPITIYIERFYRFIFIFNQGTKIEEMKDVIFWFGYIFSIIILLFLRKKSNIRFFSQDGVDVIINFINKALPFYLFITLALSIFEFSQYIIFNKLFFQYRVIESYLLLDNILNILQSIFIVVGTNIILLVINYLGFPGEIQFTNIVSNYVNNIEIKWRKIFSIKIWVLLWILLWIIIGSSTTLSFTWFDSQVAIATPILTTVNKRIDDDIHLYRNPFYDKAFYAKTVHEDIEIKFPVFTNLKPYIIKNPSNFSSSYPTSFLEGPHTYDDTVSISHIVENQYIKYLEIDTKEEIKYWHEYNFTLNYETSIRPKISIFESPLNRTSLGNGAYSIRYTLTIDNDSPYSLYAHKDFSTIKITPYITRNISVIYYENNIEKKFEEYMYDIENGYFYPVIYVPANTNLKFSYNIIGVH